MGCKDFHIRELKLNCKIGLFITRVVNTLLTDIQWENRKSNRCIATNIRFSRIFTPTVRATIKKSLSTPYNNKGKWGHSVDPKTQKKEGQ